jgi:hypothetical protein
MATQTRQTISLEQAIEEVLDRRSKYGGDTYLVKVHSVAKSVQKLVPDVDKLTRTFIEKVHDAICERGGEFWGYTGKYGDSRLENTSHQIYQISEEGA